MWLCHWSAFVSNYPAEHWGPIFSTNDRAPAWRPKFQIELPSNHQGPKRPYCKLETSYVMARIQLANHQRSTNFVLDRILTTIHLMPYVILYCAKFKWKSPALAVWQGLARVPLYLVVHQTPITSLHLSCLSAPVQMGGFHGISEISTWLFRWPCIPLRSASGA